MVTTMIMQRMSVAMEYGVILKWLKKEGDKLKKGEPVVEIFGEKNEFELEAPVDGILLKILCGVDDEIPISEPIAVIGEKGEEIPDLKPKKLNALSQEKPLSAAPATQSAQKAGKVTAEHSKLPDGRIRASPRARKKAEKLVVDLTRIVGTGPEGRIVEQDVIAGQTKHPVDDVAQVEAKRVETLSPLRRTIARRMTQSALNPHITMITEIDMTEAVALRKEINRRTEEEIGIRISYNDIILKAVADVLERFPRFNATLKGNDLHILDTINLGVAMATDEGLVVPVITQANKKSISQIAQSIKALGAKARNNELTPEDLTGSTFTVSNLGPFNVDLFIPVINPPETAILALGQIKKKPIVIDDSIVIRHMMMASCAVDHRVLDGAPAGQFLAALKDTLENPYFMRI